MLLKKCNVIHRLNASHQFQVVGRYWKLAIAYKAEGEYALILGYRTEGACSSFYRDLTLAHISVRTIGIVTAGQLTIITARDKAIELSTDLSIGTLTNSGCLPRCTQVSVRLVEHKEPDWRRIAQLCEASSEQNQWANFGPVSRTLEQTIGTISNLPESSTVVASCSGTAALYAASGAFAAKLHRPLRWAISALGFATTRTGAFAGRTRVVDCDEEGFLDLARLKAIPSTEWDGLLITHTFGLKRDLSDYIDLCAELKKPLIVDSAFRFPGPRTVGPGIIEIVSFHHTKPWGFGEGGCLFVDKSDETVVRSLLNCGIGLPEYLLAYASNGKLSDLAAAGIVDQLETLPKWSPAYFAQRARISALADAANAKRLGTFDEAVVSANVPVLANHPIELRQLPPVGFECGKYYRPLAEPYPVAASIYCRIVNIPCHGDMAAIPDCELESVLRFMSDTRQ